MKKIFIGFILILSIFLLFSCETVNDDIDDDNEKEEIILTIETPVIELNERRITWNKIKDAERYRIFINNSLESITENNYYDVNKNISGDIYIISEKYVNNHVVRSEKSNVVHLEKEVDVVTNSHLNIFTINDTHGALKNEPDVQYDESFAKVGSYIKELEKDEPIIKIANGDIFQGSYVSNMTHGRIFIDILNELSFDCFVIGNHEFDWGFDKIAQYKDGDLTNGEANFDFLGCNIIDKATGERVSWLKPYTIKEINNLKVGIIGSILEAGESSISADRVADYEFIDPLPLIRNYSKELRDNYNCDLVILSCHDYDTSFNNSVSNLPFESKIDGIICGHTHQSISENLINSDSTILPVIQCYAKSGDVGYLEYTIMKGNISSSIHKATVSNYEEDSDILKIFNNYNDLFVEGDTVVAYSSSYLSKSTLGRNYACDGMKEILNVDFSAINTGGVRETISSGAITKSDIYNAFPFDNQIYILNIKGSVFKNYYYSQSNYLYFNNDFNINDIEDNKYYKFALIDYVFKGSYAQYYLKNVEYQTTDYYIRDIVEQEIKKVN